MQQDQTPSPPMMARVATAGKPKVHVVTAIARPTTAAPPPDEGTHSMTQTGGHGNNPYGNPSQPSQPGSSPYGNPSQPGSSLAHLNFRTSQSSRYAPPLQLGSINSIMGNAAAAAAAAGWTSKSGARSFHIGGPGPNPSANSHGLISYESDQASSSSHNRNDSFLSHYRSDTNVQLLGPQRRLTDADGGEDPSLPTPQQTHHQSSFIRKDPQVRLHQDPRTSRPSLNHFSQQAQSPSLNHFSQQAQPQALGGPKVVTSITRVPPFQSQTTSQSQTATQSSSVSPAIDDDNDRFSPSRIQSSMRKLAAAMNSMDTNATSSLIADPSPLGSMQGNSSRSSGGMHYQVGAGASQGGQGQGGKGQGQQGGMADFSATRTTSGTYSSNVPFTSNVPFSSSASFSSKILAGVNRPKPPSTMAPLNLINPLGATSSSFSPLIETVNDDLGESDRISPPEANKSGKVVKIAHPPSPGLGIIDQYGTLTAFPASHFPTDGDRTSPHEADRDKSIRIEPVSPGPGNWGGGGYADRGSPSTKPLIPSLLNRNRVPINVPTSSFESMSNSSRIGKPLGTGSDSGSSRIGPIVEEENPGISTIPSSFNMNASGRNRRMSQVLDNVLMRAGTPLSNTPRGAQPISLEALLPASNVTPVSSPSFSKPKSNPDMPREEAKSILETKPSIPLQRTGSTSTKPDGHQDFLNLSFAMAPSAKSRAPSLSETEIAKLLGGPPDAEHSKALEGYSVGQVIGEGGFCEVRIGVHHFSQRKVAIKIVDKKQLTDTIENKRMQREIRVMKHLQHEVIVKLFEVLETDSFLYLVMENCPNGTLLDHVRATKRLKEPETAYLLQQIVSGLQHCHYREVVHRDIKLENILLGSDNEMKIIDFGLSAFFLPGKMLRVHCGSPSYAAPEIVARKQYEAEPVDVWSLGIVFFAMLSGYLPFYSNNGNKQELCDKILAGKFGMPDHVSSPAADLLHRMLHVDPSKRITFAEFWDHPWIRQASRWEATGLVANAVKTDTSTGAVYADEQLLQVMEEAGYSRSGTLQSLLLGEFNSLTACYYLLAEVKIEDFKKQRAYGGKVDAKLGNVTSLSGARPPETKSSRTVRLSLPSGARAGSAAAHPGK